MERTLISFNVPNLITIPLMAFGGFLLAGMIWQLMRKSGVAPGLTGSADDDADGGGY